MLKITNSNPEAVSLDIIHAIQPQTLSLALFTQGVLLVYTQDDFVLHLEVMKVEAEEGGKSGFNVSGRVSKFNRMNAPYEVDGVPVKWDRFEAYIRTRHGVFDNKPTSPGHIALYRGM